MEEDRIKHGLGALVNEYFQLIGVVLTGGQIHDSECAISCRLYYTFIIYQHTLKKIELIAAGILRKNYKFVRRLEEIETRIKNLSQRKNHAKEQLDALKIQLSLDKPNTCYKVNNSDNSSGNSLAVIIADAILKEPQTAQLVARFHQITAMSGQMLAIEAT